MATKVEIGLGAAAILCFAGAADAFFGLGTAAYLIDLCLSNPDSAPQIAGSMPMPDGGHGLHVASFLSAGLLSTGLALCWEWISQLFGRGEAVRPEGRARRRLIASIIYVARFCENATPKDVAETFQAVTGEVLKRGEISMAVRYLRSSSAAPMERILAKVESDAERRRILSAVCSVWYCHGLDSERATRAIERIAAALGLKGNEINSALDATWTADASKILKDFDVIARRTVSRVTTGAQRITTRIRGVG